ncbi:MULTISPECIES: DUF2721 domain-containing protein [Novosphingopyxis]|uniref:DUF2721 domain-containing protein n=1 Tax=Novosphingopyxis TaxID=2709686 RepID=UPI0016514ADD|nr:MULTISPECIES: DUF2721 domain-containing protein [Novosphingopyxis]MBH9536293.1 DUF2721 domain-containing protein [Novosphingopyxis sp. YJ-S2-01]
MEDLLSQGPGTATVLEVLQTALTPAFLLVALGSMLNLFTGRLTRIIDRARDREALYDQTTGPEHERLVYELRMLERRMTVTGRAIWFGVAAAVVVCVMIGMLFLIGLADAELSVAIVATFLLALTLMATALAHFMFEVQLSTRVLHVRAEYLEYEEGRSRS